MESLRVCRFKAYKGLLLEKGVAGLVLLRLF